MTDDELDRALFALPLEEPPAGLRAGIMSATVYRPPAMFRAWEMWLLALVVPLAGWLVYLMLFSSPGASGRTVDVFEDGMRALGLFSRWTYVWLGLGAFWAWAISSLTFMPTRRRTVYNR